MPESPDAVGRHVVVEPVVGGEREDAVLAAPARDDVSHPEAVRLEHVDVVEVRVLRRGSCAGTMPSARSARNTFSFAPGLSAVAAADDLHVARPQPGALDLEVALVVAAAVGVAVVADDRDQVLRVRAVALELVALGAGLLALVLVAPALAGRRWRTARLGSSW